MARHRPNAERKYLWKILTIPTTISLTFSPAKQSGKRRKRPGGYVGNRANTETAPKPENIQRDPMCLRSSSETDEEPEREPEPNDR